MPEGSRASSRGFPRLTWIDVVIGGVLLVLAVASVSAPDPSFAYEFTLSQPLVYTFAVIGSLPYLFVRHFPTAVYVVASVVVVALTLLHGYFGLLPTYLGFAILWVAFAATPPRAVLALLVTLAGFGVLGLQRAPMWDTPAALTNVVGFSAVWALGFALARWSKRQRRRVAEAERREAVARAEERSRLARELHDSVSNSLAAISVQLQLLEEDTTDPRTRRTAALLSAESRTAREELRRLLVVLRNEPDETRGETDDGDPLDAAVSAHRALGHTVEVAADPRTAAVPTGVRYALGRAVSELLANARQHAPGSPVSITLEAVDQTLRLSARNPLTEAPPRGRGDSFGLVGLRERADEFGGTVTAGVRDGSYEVRVEIPGAVP